MMMASSMVNSMAVEVWCPQISWRKFKIRAHLTMEVAVVNPHDTGHQAVPGVTAITGQEVPVTEVDMVMDHRHTARVTLTRMASTTHVQISPTGGHPLVKSGARAVGIQMDGHLHPIGIQNEAPLPIGSIVLPHLDTRMGGAVPLSIRVPLRAVDPLLESHPDTPHIIPRSRAMPQPLLPTTRHLQGRDLIRSGKYKTGPGLLTLSIGSGELDLVLLYILRPATWYWHVLNEKNKNKKTPHSCWNFPHSVVI